MTKFPELPQIQIATPCPKSWETMTGDDQQRFCDHCEKHVHNFSEMDATEVRELIDTGEKVCVRMERRPDGSLVTREKPRRANLLSRLSGFAAFATAFAIAGCSKKPEVAPPITGAICAPSESAPEATSIEQEPVEVIMGDMCVEAPPEDVSVEENDERLEPLVGRIAAPISENE